jgi:hypothetical protein
VVVWGATGGGVGWGGGGGALWGGAVFAMPGRHTLTGLGRWGKEEPLRRKVGVGNFKLAEFTPPFWPVRPSGPTGSSTIWSKS